MSGLLPGYKRLPGKDRRYRTPSGKTISRREYDNRRLKKLGWKNRYEMEQFRQSGKYNKWYKRLVESGKKPSELTGFSTWAVTIRDTDPDRAEKEVQDIRKEYPKSRAGRKRADVDPRLRNPDGPLAELLVALGLRDSEDEWAVGDTP